MPGGGPRASGAGDPWDHGAHAVHDARPGARRMILAVGEALMEFRRASLDGRLTAPGEWAGPFPSGAPAIFASVAARLGAPAGLAAAVGDDRFGRALAERLGRDGVRGDAL